MKRKVNLLTCVRQDRCLYLKQSAPVPDLNESYLPFSQPQFFKTRHFLKNIENRKSQLIVLVVHGSFS